MTQKPIGACPYSTGISEDCVTYRPSWSTDGPRRNKKKGDTTFLVIEMTAHHLLLISNLFFKEEKVSVPNCIRFNRTPHSKSSNLHCFPTVVGTRFDSSVDSSFKAYIDKAELQCNKLGGVTLFRPNLIPRHYLFLFNPISNSKTSRFITMCHKRL